MGLGRLARDGLELCERATAIISAPAQGDAPTGPRQEDEWISVVAAKEQRVVLAEPLQERDEAGATFPGLHLADEGGLFGAEGVDVEIVTRAAEAGGTGKRVSLRLDADAHVLGNNFALNAVALSSLTGTAKLIFVTGWALFCVAHVEILSAGFARQCGPAFSLPRHRLNRLMMGGGHATTGAVEHPLKSPHGHPQKSADPDRGEVAARSGVIGPIAAQSEIFLPGRGDTHCKRSFLSHNSVPFGPNQWCYV